MKVTKEPLELVVISNFHHQRPHGGSNSGLFDSKLNALTTRPLIHDNPLITPNLILQSWKTPHINECQKINKTKNLEISGRL